MKQARWTTKPIANDLKLLFNRSDAGIHREVAKCVANLSNRLSAIEAARSEVAPSAKMKIRHETSEGGAGSSYVGGSSS